MKIFKPIEFNEFLEGITVLWLFDEKNRATLIDSGVDPTHWPETISKNILTDFITMSILKSPEWAKFMVSDKYDTIISNFKIDSVMEVLESFKETYDFNLKYYRVKEFAKKIEINPEKFDELFFEFNKKSPSSTKLFDLSESIKSTVEENKTLIESGMNKVILPDFPILSDQIGGFNPQRVSIVSAISGFGKTKLAVNLALSASKLMPVIFINMEMGKYDFVSMFIHNACDIKNKDWYSGDYVTEFNLNKISEFKEQLEGSNKILYTDGSSLSIEEIISKILVTCQDFKTSFIVIDYDQKIITSDAFEEWKAMVRAVEKIEDVSKKTNSHIVLLAQANDDGDPKSSKRAKQPASCVINFTKNDAGDNIIRSIKNRFGVSNFSIVMDYRPEISKIRELYLEDDLNRQHKTKTIVKSKVDTMNRGKNEIKSPSERYR